MRKKFKFAALLLFSVLVIVGFTKFTKLEDQTATYTSDTYHITLNYDKDWNKSPYYSNRYEGENGFFQLVASTGENISIDDVVKLMTSHPLVPYGSSPTITTETIDGQEARLILPSNDAEVPMEHMASLVIRYPKAIEINGTEYSYLILHADEEHIMPIGNTIRFLKII